MMIIGKFDASNFSQKQKNHPSAICEDGWVVYYIGSVSYFANNVLIPQNATNQVAAKVIIKYFIASSFCSIGAVEKGFESHQIKKAPSRENILFFLFGANSMAFY